MFDVAALAKDKARVNSKAFAACVLEGRDVINSRDAVGDRDRRRGHHFPVECSRIVAQRMEPGVSV